MNTKQICSIILKAFHLQLKTQKEKNLKLQFSKFCLKLNFAKKFVFLIKKIMSHLLIIIYNNEKIQPTTENLYLTILLQKISPMYFEKNLSS